MKKSILHVVFGVLYILSIYPLSGQTKECRIMFYNLENLFDTIDNPHKNDEEFLPEGSYKWNSYRYWKKLNNIYQVIAAAGNPEPPDIIGVCEVESKKPLENLTINLPLSKFEYSIIHKDSPDPRGIDVALMYRGDKVKCLEYKYIPVVSVLTPRIKTRDILYSKFIIGRDTLHFFVNHWPSRTGGEAKTETKRLAASGVLCNAIDSIRNFNASAYIIIMGDFNDEPQNKSILQIVDNGFTNMGTQFYNQCNCGSIKYRSHWQNFDQILVSQSVFRSYSLVMSSSDFQIFQANFLLSDDKTYGGVKPNRTYIGPKYNGGFSDHLPVLLDIKFK